MAQDLPFMTDEFIHAILDLLDIEVPEYHRTKSLFHADFDRDRKRIFDGREYKGEGY